MSSENPEYQGGYVAVLHSLEESFYGPGSPINVKGKILLYIRHRLLRDWETGAKHIGKREIVKAIGANIRTVERAIDDLVKDNIVAVYHQWDEREWKENQYKLHPAYFGKDIVYNGEKKGLKYIPGGKAAGQKPGSSTGEATGMPAGEMTGTFPIESGAKPLLKNPLKELFPKDFNFVESEEEILQRGKDKFESQKKMMGLA
jgi:hypothetical protein